MKFSPEFIDIRIVLTDEGFVCNMIPSSNTRCLPMCEVVEVYYVPMDCKGRILIDQRNYGKTYKHET